MALVPPPPKNYRLRQTKSKAQRLFLKKKKKLNKNYGNRETKWSQNCESPIQQIQLLFFVQTEKNKKQRDEITSVMSSEPDCQSEEPSCHLRE